MKTKEHAKLSASSSHRWIKCSGSVLLESESEAEPPSEYAEYGTASHQLAEYCLKKDISANLPLGQVFNKSKNFPDGFTVDEEMAEAVQHYLDYCNYITEDKCDRYIEKKVDFSKYATEGFGTADFIYVAPDILHVVDLKMGKGVKVNAEWNTQGMLYALGAMKEFRPTPRGESSGIVRISIVQPRLDHISEWDISVGDLLYWAESELKPKAKQAWEEKPVFNAGEEQCRFCKAKATCKALAEYSLKDAIDTFTDIPTATETNLKDIHTLNNDELGQLLPKVKTIINWANSLESLALSELKAGRKITGYKLVQGRAGNRKWGDEKAVERKLTNMGIKKSEMFSKKLLTPTQMCGVLKKKHIETERIEAYWNSPEGKLTIAVEADKRPEIIPESNIAFTDIES